MDRLHIGLQATAITNAIGASLNGKEISMKELIGDAPYREETKEVNKDNTDNTEIYEWKKTAKEKGLKTGK